MSRSSLGSEVEGDLDEIWDLIGIQRQNPAAANRCIDKLYEAFALLASQPLLGQLREDLGQNIRLFVVGWFVVLFRPTDYGIQVAQVVHSARDIDGLARTKRLT